MYHPLQCFSYSVPCWEWNLGESKENECIPYLYKTINLKASLVAQLVKNLPAMQETQVGKIPWRSKWQPTPVFLPGECHGQRKLAGFSAWG